jgi:DHA2 family multidrug resistance protein
MAAQDQSEDPGHRTVTASAAANIVLPPATRLIVTLCTVLATLMQSLDSTIANVALPYMQGSMSASQEEINWVLTSYIVAAAIMTAPTSFLAARFGRTKLFVTAISGFTLASILCGMARSLEQIVVFRLIQGMFGASLVPLSQAVMYDIYPPDRRGTAMSVWTMGVMIGPIFGPILGGWLTDNYNWRWIFYINVPFGILAALGLLTFLRESPNRSANRLDWIGFGALSLGIGAFQMMLDRGETLDWFSAREIRIEAGLAVVGFHVFLVQFFLAKRPFISPTLFTDVNFVVGIILYAINGLIMYSTLALLAPYLQKLMNYPVITSGIVLAPRGVGVMLAAMVCGRLLKRSGPRLLLGIGLIIGVYVLYDMMFWTPDISVWRIAGVGVGQGISIGLVAIPLNITTFSTLPPERRIEGTSIYALMRNLGSAIGISVTGALLQMNIQTNHAIVAGEVGPFNRALHATAAARIWDVLSAHGAALLDQEINRQAQIIAYIDDFKLMFVLALVTAPLVLLTRGARQA